MKNVTQFLEQFEADAKLQGGSPEAIRKAEAKVLIEIAVQTRDSIRDIAASINQISESSTRIENYGVEEKPSIT